MTWNRYGSEFTRDRRWDGVSYEARWHYIAVVAECADSERYDCRIPLRLALRASDAVDPLAATEALVAAGFATIEGHDFVIVDGEQRHMPPPHMRNPARKVGQRKRTAESRARKCDRGDHDRHCPETCGQKSAGNGTGNALPQNGTEQNRHLESAVPTESQREVTPDIAATFLPPRAEVTR